MEHKPNAGKPWEELSPAQRVIGLFGIIDAAHVAGLTTEALRRWTRSKAKGGTGGLIPQQHQCKYLAEAKQRGLRLTAEDLIADARH